MNKRVDEDTKTEFEHNVSSKVNKADKGGQLPGEKQVINKKAHLKATETLPDYSQGISKDHSKNSKVALSAPKDSQVGTMKNMPMLDKLDEEDLETMDMDNDDENEEGLDEAVRTRSHSSVYSAVLKKLKARPGSLVKPSTLYKVMGNNARVENNTSPQEAIWKLSKEHGHKIETVRHEGTRGRKVKGWIYRGKEEHEAPGFTGKLRTFGADAGYAGTNAPVGRPKKAVNEKEFDLFADLTEEELNAVLEIRESILKSLFEGLMDYLPEDQVNVDMSEHVNVMFEGTEDLSEDFKTKAKNIFEAAVNAEISNRFAAILESAADLVMENEMNLTEEFDEKIEDALVGIVESWIETNKVPLQTKMKTEITEDFIRDLKSLMETHNIMFPEEQVDVVDALTERILELEDETNELMETNISLRKALIEDEKASIIATVSEGLTDVNVSKFVNLCENIEFDEDFETKIGQLRESYFGKPKRGKDTITAETVLTEEEIVAEQNAANIKPQTPIEAQLSRFAPRRS